ncbi:hypothetical protein SAMN02745136_01209 [Anaerocolumna jejuensis DSM 15929]|uniref:Uncharacterized protein n=1 Tax=Anaerocolumna jejuensis DSM 15929 TaxID=1121322 RepID=A0A1M6MWJ9_9FIRM|nr:hypothetical protein [Anaerocolumna jejuensis]SHJ87868.1 hypothetical protein SAMN02745136_01209 [Anaerocolumna jejuensis DSM 15929]
MIFWKKRDVKISKTENESNTEYILDYGGHKDRELFPDSLLADVTENSGILVVLDTELLYTVNYTNKESKLLELKEELEKRKIPYREIVTQKEADVTVLGVKIQNKKKVNCYQLGLAVNTEQLKGLKLFEDYCVYAYLFDKETQPEILLELFENAGGNSEVLGGQAQIQLYIDHYLKRIKATENHGRDGIIEEKLAKYNG